MFKKSLVPCERLATCSQVLQLFASGFLVVLGPLVCFERFALKFSSVFRAVCSLCSQHFFFSERFAPSCQSPSFFRLVCSLFSSSRVSFERFASCFLISLISVGGLLPVLNCSGLWRAVCLFFSPLRAVCSIASKPLCSLWFSKSLVSFERFGPCSEILCLS